jgi:hypothetical protein
LKTIDFTVPVTQFTSPPPLISLRKLSRFPPLRGEEGDLDMAGGKLHFALHLLSLSTRNSDEVSMVMSLAFPLLLTHAE